MAVINVPTDYGTVAAALAAASSGDVVVLASGTYTETGLDLPADVTLRREPGEVVTFDGGGSGTIIQSTTVGSGVWGITFTNAAWGIVGAEVTVVECVFKGLSSGGISTTLGDIYRCRFYDASFAVEARQVRACHVRECTSTSWIIQSNEVESCEVVGCKGDTGIIDGSSSNCITYESNPNPYNGGSGNISWPETSAYSISQDPLYVGGDPDNLRKMSAGSARTGGSSNYALDINSMFCTIAPTSYGCFQHDSEGKQGVSLISKGMYININKLGITTGAGADPVTYPRTHNVGGLTGLRELLYVALSDQLGLEQVLFWMTSDGRLGISGDHIVRIPGASMDKLFEDVNPLVQFEHPGGVSSKFIGLPKGTARTICWIDEEESTLVHTEGLTRYASGTVAARDRPYSDKREHSVEAIASGGATDREGLREAFSTFVSGGSVRIHRDWPVNQEPFDDTTRAGYTDMVASDTGSGQYRTKTKALGYYTVTFKGYDTRGTQRDIR